MRIQYADVCGTPALREIEARLEAAGYRQTYGALSAGFYSSHPSDGAPGWQDWTYELAVAMREGEELRDFLRGL